METKLRFETLTIIVFCAYLFWGSFGIDITLSHGAERFPLHRLFILFTAFIFLFNINKIIFACANNKLLLALIFYVLITALWANDSPGVVKNFVFLASTMFISIMTAYVIINNRMLVIRSSFWLFLLMTLASIVAGLYFPKIGINTTDFGKPRWIGITTHPNALGVQGLTLIWLSLNLFFSTKSVIEKLIILFATTEALYVIIKADSMTSLITALAIIGYTCYCYLFGRLTFSIKITLLFIGVLSLIIFGSFYMSTSEITGAAMESTGRDATFTGRSFLWEKAMYAASENPIIGHGFDDLELLTKKYHILMSHLHNGYIETLVKGGLIASILFVVIVIKTFACQLKVKKIYKKDFIFLSTGLVMVLLHNITESSILRGMGTLSIFLLFIIASSSLIAEKAMREHMLKDK